jgi:large subunit ribosomal protein L7/L12
MPHVSVSVTTLARNGISHRVFSLHRYEPSTGHILARYHTSNPPAAAMATVTRRHVHSTILRTAAADDEAKVSATTEQPPKDEAKPEVTTDTSAAAPAPAAPTEKKERIKPQKGKPPPPTEAKSPSGIRKVDVQAISPSLEGGPSIVDGVRQYSTPELTKDAAFHKAGLNDPTRPDWQNPLHHNNPDFDTRFFREDFATEAEFEAAVFPAPPLDLADGTPTYPQNIMDLADDMVHLTMLEMNELINRIADHYEFHEGILSPEGVGGDDDGAGGDDGDGEAAAPEVEKTAFDVKLVSYDASVKIKIIKEVRVVVPGLGLKEAKELVEGAPVVLQKGVSKEVAEQSKAKLEALGAVMEIV